MRKQANLNQILADNKLGNAIGDFLGSEYLNLDSLVREPLDKALSSKYGGAMRYVYRNSGLFGLVTSQFLPEEGFVTRREQKQQQLKIDNSNLSAKGNQLLGQFGEATNAAKEITKLDAQIAEIQSARLKLLPGDGDALKASLSEEKKINQERDKQLKILTKYQQTLQTSINVYKTRLEDIEQRFLGGEIDPETYESETNNLTGLLEATEIQLKGVNGELNKVAKNLSLFQRRLRNSNERVDGFLAQSDRELQLQRAAIIEGGIANGDGRQTIEVELEEAQQQDLQRRIDFIKGELTNLEEDLKSPELADGVRRVKQRLIDSNVPINETTLQRIIEESPVKADRDAAEGLLKQLRDQTKLAGITEQLANTLQQNRNALIDFNRTIDDYFFNINQQIKEAQIEVLRVIDQIIQTNIRNKLQSALSPNANSFVNGLISSTQSMLDQAASYAEKILGQRGARIQFAGQKRSLQLELQDFARNVRGAGDALVEFKNKISGAASDIPKPSSNNSSNSTSRNTTAPSSNVLPVPSLPVIRGSGQLPPPPPIANAQKLTNFAIDKQEQKLDLQDSLTANQEKKALKINIDNAIKSDRRRVEQEIKDKQYQLSDSESAIKDLISQFDYQTADSEAAKNIRAVNQAFSQRWREITNQIQFFNDEVNSLDQIIADIPRLINLAKTDEERNIIYSQEANAKLLRDQYQTNLNDLKEQGEGLLGMNQKALDFVNAQNALKKQNALLNKQSLLLNQKAQIAEQRGTLEAQRQVKIAQEKLRLDSAIVNLKLNNKPGEQLDDLIEGERKKSQVNTENIGYDSQIAELDLEKQLLDLQTGKGDKEAGFLSRMGFNLESDKLRRQNAIAQENLRFERKLIELRKKYVDRPEELAELTRAATELNRVNLSSIENQFKSLGMTVEDYFISSTQGFFNQFVTNFFDGKSQRDQQILQERLRYAEELNQFENQYREEPGKLAHLKNRARELNEQKLDQISGQFSIFGRVVNLAKQALSEFINQMVVMAAKQSAAKFLSSIIGGAIGGIGGGGISAVGNDFGSSAAGVSAFVADEGATVGEGRGIKSRKLSDRVTNWLKSVAPGVANAWNSEGEGAQLGVFHTGEELLSRKTGEAGRYQALKQQLGIKPLAKIGVFADGGTVGFDAGSNILAGFSDHRPRIDLSSLTEGRLQRAALKDTASHKGRREIHLTQNIYTPEADSFQLNADQRNQDLLESLQRGF